VFHVKHTGASRAKTNMGIAMFHVKPSKPPNRIPNSGSELTADSWIFTQSYPIYRILLGRQVKTRGSISALLQARPASAGAQGGTFRCASAVYKPPRRWTSAAAEGLVIHFQRDHSIICGLTSLHVEISGLRVR